MLPEPQLHHSGQFKNHGWREADRVSETPGPEKKLCDSIRITIGKMCNAGQEFWWVHVIIW